MLISIVALVVSIFSAAVSLYVGWWVPNALRILGRLRDIEPIVFFSIGSYSGGSAGRGIGVTLQNKGRISAYNLALYLPTIDAPACPLPELEAGATPYVKVSLSEENPLHSQPLEGLKAQLAYQDRFGNRYTASLNLTQEKRADGRYNVISLRDQLPEISRPSFRFRDLWRLRKQV